MKNLQTDLVNDPRHAPQLIQTLQPPIYRASTIVFPSTAHLLARKWTDRYDYSYGTHGTPTTYTLADQLIRLEGGNFCLLAPSGLSAIHLVNSTFLKLGDEVWIMDNAYDPNTEHLNYLRKQFGIIVKTYNPVDVDSFQPSEKCKLLWLEATGSVTMEFPNLKGLIRKAKQYNILTALDHTWGAGLAFSPFDLSDEHLAVDISVHALTKYPSGGGDVLMGSVITQNEQLHHQLLRSHSIQGLSVSGDDCATIYRSLPSMALRYKQQMQNCLTLIEFLKQQPEFSQVLHPSLAECSGHEYWREVCQTGLSAGLVSVIVDEQFDYHAVCRFCDALQVFKLGFSWGGASSLVMLYDVKRMRQLSQSHLKCGYLVRFCVGLENVEDLIEDIERGLMALKIST